MHYIIEGSPSSPRVLLLLHGEPFWSQVQNQVRPSPNLILQTGMAEGDTSALPALVGCCTRYDWFWIVGQVRLNNHHSVAP